MDRFPEKGSSHETLIVGTGVIGVIYGWALTEAGVDVTHFVRHGKFAKYRDVKTFLKDKDLLRECYASTKELLELCRLRGVDLKKYPEIGAFNLPTWLFIPLFRWLYTYNESMQRFTAHAADSLQEARENYNNIMQTANELSFDMPHTKAVGVYLK